MMTITKPNRTRSQDADRNEMQQKQSGDQHILPVDEPATDPHRPHRVNRQDMQKTLSDSDNARANKATGK
jgi:hypothetical protein